MRTFSLSEAYAKSARRAGALRRAARGAVPLLSSTERLEDRTLFSAVAGPSVLTHYVTTQSADLIAPSASNPASGAASPAITSGNSVNFTGTATVLEDSTSASAANKIDLSTFDGSAPGNFPNGLTTAHGSLSAVNGPPATIYAYTPVANYNGPDSFTFTTNNNNTVTINITVVAVNDAPTASVAIPVSSTEDAGAQTVLNFVTNISAGPADEVTAGQTVTLSPPPTINFVSATNTTTPAATTAATFFSVQPALVSNGAGGFNLTFQTAPNVNGTANLSFTLTDSGANGGANGDANSRTFNFSISVTAQNDAPTANPVSISFPENIVANTVIGTITPTDVDDANFTYTLTPSAASAGNFPFSISASGPSGAISLTSPVNFEGAPANFTGTVTVSDNVNPAISVPITIVVTDVNEQATVSYAVGAGSTSGTAIAVAEGATTAPLAGLSFADIDNLNTSTYSLTISALDSNGTTGGNAFGILTINGGSATLPTGITSITGNGTGPTLTVGASSKSALDSLLRTLVFSPGNNVVPASVTGRITFTGSDIPGASQSGSTLPIPATGTPTTVFVTSTNINDAPVITYSGSVASSFTENGSAAPIFNDTNFSITDEESNGLTQATVTITNFVSGDLLSIPQGSVPAGFAVSSAGTQSAGVISNNTGSITITASPAIASPYTSLITIIRALQFSIPNNNNPNTTTRVFSVVVTDNGTNGLPASPTASPQTSAPATDTVTVTPVNSPPTITTNTGLSVTEGLSTPIGQAQLNATDPDSSPAQLTYTATTNNGSKILRNGVAIVGPQTFTQAEVNSGIIAYLNGGANVGTDTIGLSLNDGNNTVTGTISVAVTLVNDPPVAGPGIFNGATENTPFSVAAPGLLTGATDEEGNLPITVTAINGTPVNSTGTTNIPIAHGILSVLANGAFTYTPNTQFNGNETFNFSLADSLGATSTASATIVVTGVNDNPTAIADSYPGTAAYPGATEDTTFSIPLAQGVLANDTDPDDTILTVASVNGTAIVAGGTTIALAKGSLLMFPDGHFTFTPLGNANGIQQFAYVVSDGHPSGVGGNVNGAVTISIAAVNDPPVLTTNITLNLNQHATATITSTQLTTTDQPDESTAAQIVYTLQTLPASGTLRRQAPVGTFTNLNLTTNSTFTQDDINTGKISYVNGAGESSSDSFLFKVSDSAPSSPVNQPGAGFTFNITLNAVNDPPAATISGLFVTEGSSAFLNLGLQVNDPDGIPGVPSPDPSTVTINVSSVTRGFLYRNQNLPQFGPPPSVTSFTKAELDSGLIKFQSDGTEQTSPATNPVITFTMSDSAGATSGSNTVTLTVQYVTDTPPAGGATSETVNQGTTTVFQILNPAAANGTPATAGAGSPAYAVFLQPFIVQAPSGGLGTVTVQAGAGTITYTAGPNSSGTETLKYELINSSNQVFDQTLTIIVNKVEHAPTFTIGPNQNLPAADAVLTVHSVSNFITNANANDAGETVISYTVSNSNNLLFTAQPAINASGTLTYTPVVGAKGLATVTVIANDNGTSNTASAPQTFTISIDIASAVPTTTAAISIAEGSTFTSAAALNPNNHAVTYAIITPPTGGTVAFNGNNFTYTNTNAANRPTDTFTYTVTDNDGAVVGTATTSGTVTIPLTDGAPVVGALSADTRAQSSTGSTPIDRLVTFTDPATTGTWTYTVTATPTGGGSAIAVASGSTASKSFTFSGSLLNSGTYNVSVVVSDGQLSGSTTYGLTITPSPFVVTSFVSTPSGFNVTFNRPFNGSAGVLNLYGANSDVLVTSGSANGPTVRGSLVWDIGSTVASFVATGDYEADAPGQRGVLDAGQYFVTLKSGASAFSDTNGVALSGANGGTTLGDFTTSFGETAAGSTRILSIDDFARGPNQAVNIKDDAGIGFPVILSERSTVTAVQFSFTYDSTLLNVTNIAGASGFTGNFSTAAIPGTTRVRAAFSGTAASAQSGTGPIAFITASVPAGAAYGDSELIHLEPFVGSVGTKFTDASFNNVPVIVDDAVHSVNYVGDADTAPGSRSYDAFDSGRIQQFVANYNANPNSGALFFPAYLNTDAVVVADTNNDSQLTAGDAGQVQQETAANNAVPVTAGSLFIPSIPAGGTTLSLVFNNSTKITSTKTSKASAVVSQVSAKPVSKSVVAKAVSAAITKTVAKH